MREHNRFVVAALAASLTLGCAQEMTEVSEGRSGDSDIEAVIEAVMDRWEVPGLAVVVVERGRPPVLGGYGTRALGESLPVDEETFLYIASNSKTVTAYALGMLVDDGALSWQDQATRHIPEFQTPDPYVTEHVAIDDLICHRSGLSEAVLGGFQDPGYTVADLLGDVRRTELTERFRDRNNYCQFGMAILGEIVLRASGETWEEVVRQRILEPLEMDSTFTSNADFAERVGLPHEVANIMRPAVSAGGVVTTTDWDKVGTSRLYAPAGGMISTMSDIARWIEFRLNDGVHEGTRLISAASLHEIRAPRIPADFSKLGFPYTHFHPDAELISVGYGQYSFEHRGRRVIMHNGGWMSSVVAVMPGESLGVGVFTDAWYDEPAPGTSIAFVNAVALEVFDHQLGFREGAWNRRMHDAVNSL
jgi:CubicO group peptidase (beta-lactamase class C family)